jgi:hypothetical protein
MSQADTRSIENALLRVFGALVGSAGLALLASAAFITATGGTPFMTSSGYVLVILVAALALLMLVGGFRMAVAGKTSDSLAPPWALIAAGAMMMLAVSGFWFFGFLERETPHMFGSSVFALLGLYWLRSGVRGRSTRRIFKPKR